MDGAKEDLVDMFIVHTTEEIQGLIDAHEQFKGTLGEADKEFNAIVALGQEVNRIAQQFGIQGASENPYTTLSPQVGFYCCLLHFLIAAASFGSPYLRSSCSLLGLLYTPLRCFLIKFSFNLKINSDDL